MSEKQIYNEGRVVGYSTYELYVKNAIAKGADVIATEQEWLASSLAMGSSMLVKIPNHTSTDQFIDIPFPSETLLSAANTIVATFFDGSAEYENNWATKITDYGKGIKNSGSGSPSGYLNAGDVPHKDAVHGEPPIDTTYRQFQDYLRITDGMIIQAGTWTPTGGTPSSDLTEVQIKAEGSKSPVPVLRLYFDYNGSITTQPQILLTGFTDRNVLLGVSGVVGGSTNTATNHYKNGGFLGPSVFPWGSKITFIIPSNYMNKLTAVKLHVASSPNYTYPKIDVYNDLETVYSTSSQLYAPYTSSTPSSPAGVQFTYDYILSPSQKTSLINVYTPNENVYPPAMYVGVPDKLNTGTQQNIRQYPVDVVAPGTVKMFKGQSDSTKLSAYESTFVGTTGLNISSDGIVSMAKSGSTTLYQLNCITSDSDNVTVTRNTTTGAWEISVSYVSYDVKADPNSPTIGVLEVGIPGKSTFYIQDLQTFAGGPGITVNTPAGSPQTTISTNIVAGTGINVSTDSNNQITITNTRPVLSGGDTTGLGYQYYRVWYPTGNKYLKKRNDSDPGDTWITRGGYGTGVTRGVGSGYSWKTTVLNRSYGDTAHREKLPVSYMSSFSGGNNLISNTIFVSERTSVDAGDPDWIPSDYTDYVNYARYDYCTYNGKKYRCMATTTTGPFDTHAWREVTAVVLDYIPFESYLTGDYCMYADSYGKKQYICTSSTSGTAQNPEQFDPTKWREDTTIYPAIGYNFCILDALSSNRTDPNSANYIPYCASLRYTHGISQNTTYGEVVGNVPYDYYPWDLGLVARITLTPEACKKMFFNDENIQLKSNSRALIDGANSGAASSIVNWGALTGIDPSSPASSSSYRLSYPVSYRIVCRYPFIVDNGQVMMASWDNINAVNNGWLADHFSSTVGYTLKRDVNGLELSSSNDYHDFAMIFDIVMEAVSDGFNNQIIQVINYESKPEPPYVIACSSAHMEVSITPRILTIQNIT